MAICVVEDNQGDLIPTTTPIADCTGFVVLDTTDYNTLIVQETTFLGLPDITPAEGGQLLSAYLVLLVGAVVWRRLRQLPS